MEGQYEQSPRGEKRRTHLVGLETKLVHGLRQVNRVDLAIVVGCGGGRRVSLGGGEEQSGRKERTVNLLELLLERLELRRSEDSTGDDCEGIASATRSTEDEEKERTVFVPLEELLVLSTSTTLDTLSMTDRVPSLQHPLLSSARDAGEGETRFLRRSRSSSLFARVQGNSRRAFHREYQGQLHCFSRFS